MDSEYLQAAVGGPLAQILADCARKQPSDPVEYVSAALRLHHAQLVAAVQRKEEQSLLEEERLQAKRAEEHRFLRLQEEQRQRDIQRRRSHWEARSQRAAFLKTVKGEFPVPSELPEAVSQWQTRLDFLSSQLKTFPPHHWEALGTPMEGKGGLLFKAVGELLGIPPTTLSHGNVESGLLSFSPFSAQSTRKFRVAVKLFAEIFPEGVNIKLHWSPLSLWAPSLLGAVGELPMPDFEEQETEEEKAAEELPALLILLGEWLGTSLSLWFAARALHSQITGKPFKAEDETPLDPNSSEGEEEEQEELELTERKEESKEDSEEGEGSEIEESEDEA